MSEKPSITPLDVALGKVRDAFVYDYGPQHHPDLDTSRVIDFLDTVGIEAKPMLVLLPGQIPAFCTQLRRSGFNYRPEDFTDTLGQFIPEIGIIAIFRNLEFESINSGPVVTEGFMVHEQVHGSESLSHQVKYLKRTSHEGLVSFRKRRLGFAVDGIKRGSTGSFFEEGYADIYRGEYMATCAPDSFWQNLARHQNIDKFAPTDSISVTNAQGEKVRLSAKYTYLNRNKSGDTSLSYNTSSLPATALELLCSRDPDLFPLLVGARHNVSSYRSLVQRLSSQDSLYRKLSHLRYEHDDFFAGLQMVYRHLSAVDTPANL